jgi:hypothetical protein
MSEEKIESTPEVERWVNLNAASMINIENARAILHGVITLNVVEVNRAEEVEAIQRLLEASSTQTR